MIWPVSESKPDGNDADFMAQALQLASRGRFTCDPNPQVGSVVVRQGKIVGRGWHKRAGEAHAEIDALADAGQDAKGATVYVTLEPCCHFGKTPPCTQALLQAGIRRVVAAMEDPNPEVAGLGFHALRHAGIEVRCGVLNAAAEALNRGFSKRMRLGLPFVFSKLAMSLDGRTAMASGESKWITGDFARRDVHTLRAHSSAILTGIETVLADDPALTARLDDVAYEIVQPLRVILDTQLRLPPDAKLVHQPGDVLLLTASNDVEKKCRLEQQGAHVERIDRADDGRLDLSKVMAHLGQLGINRLMVEAGATLNGALLKQHLIDEWIVYIAPCIMGDTARGLVRIPGLEQMSERIQLRLSDSRMVGADLRLTYSLKGASINS